MIKLSRIPSWILSLGIAIILAVPGPGLAEDNPAFQIRDDRLIITTDKIEMTFQGGAAVSLRDRKTGEVFSGGEILPAAQNVPCGATTIQDEWKFETNWIKQGPAAYRNDSKLQAARRLPGMDVPPVLKVLSPYEAEIVYTISKEKQDEFRYKFQVDPKTGEILLFGSVRLGDLSPQRFHVPFLNLNNPAIILGPGIRILRTDPSIIECCTRAANGFTSPRVAIVEGSKSVVAIWPESVDSNDDIWLAHDPANTDTVLFTTDRDPRWDPPTIETAPLRIGLFPTWTAAARRYRECFQTITGAKPLWEQSPAWVRNIHAVHTGIPSPIDAESYYRNLSQIVDPHKLLLFYWNGDGIIAFGDHRYMTQQLGRPKPEVIPWIKEFGFKWMGYHPYMLLMKPSFIDERLQKINAKGWGLPDNYTFTPDYGGTPENFQNYFQAASADYFGNGLVINPASKEGKEYLVRNVGNYSRFHQMDGVYLDICGSDQSGKFSDEKKVMNGLTYRMGEDRILQDLQTAHPELALMSEYPSLWTVAHTFYTWAGEGYFQLSRSLGRDPFPTHPMRTALWGSFCWTRMGNLEPDEAALAGALPELNLKDDWSVARCKLFAEEEFFNDLPDEWDPEALACYRGKEGRWFQFRKLPYGDGFVAMTKKGYDLRLGRFHGQTHSPLAVPVRMQGWPAYRENGPIGLNPGRTYPFLLEKPKPDGPFVIDALPRGVYINAVRHAKKWSVVEFGTMDGNRSTADISLVFNTECARVIGGVQKHEGPFEAGAKARITVPTSGALVFLWNEAQVSGSLPKDHLDTAGMLTPWGVEEFIGRPGPRKEKVSLPGWEGDAVFLKPCRGRGYVEGWFDIPSSSSPILKFDIGYMDKDSRMPLSFSVRVNGSEVWREEVKPNQAIESRQVPLDSFTGKKVLITFSVELTKSKAWVPYYGPNVFFGNIILDGKSTVHQGKTAIRENCIFGDSHVNLVGDRFRL
jgi:hypothetical protein